MTSSFRKTFGMIASACLLLRAASCAAADDWHCGDLRFRVLVKLTSTCAKPDGWPVEMRIDARRLLSGLDADLPAGARLAVRVVCPDAPDPGRPVVSQFDPDPDEPTRGELVWLMPGVTAAGAERTVAVYLDRAPAGGAPAPGGTALRVEPSPASANAVWVDTGVMRVEMIPNADPGAPCRDLIHSWIRRDEGFDIAHKKYSILSNPCWISGEDGWRCYGVWPFQWRLVRKRVGPVRATFRFECDHAIERDGKQVPIARMGRRVSLYAGQPFVKDRQRWEVLHAMRKLNFMEESYFESTSTFGDFGGMRDLAFGSRGTRTFIHLLDARDERCYERHFSSRPRSGADGQCLTIDGIDLGNAFPGETIEYTVVQLYAKRETGESPRACAKRWQQLLTAPAAVRPVAVERRGGKRIALALEDVGRASAKPAPGAPASVPEAWRPPLGKPVIVPRPQKLTWGEGAFVLSPGLAIRTPADASDSDAWIARALCRDIAERGGVELRTARGFPGGGAAIRLRRDPGAGLRAEGYTLRVRTSGVDVVGADTRGLFYGTRTLVEMLSMDVTGQVFMPAATIEDWPDMAVRGFHLCFQAGRPDLDLAKRLIRDGIARSKMNTLVLELEGGVKFDSHPEIAAPNAISKDELRDVVDYAKRHFLEVIPQVQSLGHCDYWLFRGGAHRDLAERPERPFDYCPSNPEVYRILFDLYEEIIPIFKPRYFHIGHDEVRDLGVCPRCRGRAPHELFAEDVKKLHAHLTGKGLRVMMWPDMLLEWRNGGPPRNVHKALALLPKDIIMCDWDYRSATEFKGVGHFKDAGFATVVTPWCDAKNNLFLAKAGLEAGAMGLIGSTWCPVREPLKNYFAGLLPSAEYAWSVGRPAVEELAYRPLPRLVDQVAGQALERPAPGLVLDLAPFCNRGFRDDDRRRGWLGFGPEHDMSAVPAGTQWLGRRLFRLLDPARPGGSCIVLRGKHRYTAGGRFPRQVEGIAVDAKIAGIAFLHACGWREPLGRVIGSYRVHYEDGEVCDVPLVYGVNVMEWNSRRADAVQAAEIAWRGRTVAGENALLYSWRWANPRPAVKVTKLDFAAADTPASPILAAATCARVEE